MIGPEQKIKTLSVLEIGTINLSVATAFRPHCYVAVTFLDASGLPVTPSYGTYSLTVKPLGMENYIEITDGSNVDATLPVNLLSFSGNIGMLKFEPFTIGGATSIKITVTGNSA